MTDIQQTIDDVISRSWDELRDLAVGELQTIPVEDRRVFEYVFQTTWDEFYESILGLCNRPYAEIAGAQAKLSTLGDFSSDGVLETAALATVNTGVRKSAKLEYYLITRSLHTRQHGKVSRIRAILRNVGLL